MPLNQGTKQFWMQLGSLGLVSVITSLLACLIWGGMAVILVIIVALLTMESFLATVRSALLASTKDSWEGQPAAVSESPQLDLDWLNQKTEALHQLSFRHLQDYKLDEFGFARCLIHPQQHCIAEIHQIFPSVGESKSNLVIFSPLEQGWSIGVVNRTSTAEDSLSYLWRDSKTVVLFNPESDLSVLFQSFLEFRRQMLSDLGIALITNLSWEMYVEAENQRCQHRKQVWQRQNLLLNMIEVTRYELKPQSKWLGDYAKVKGRH